MNLNYLYDLKNWFLDIFITIKFHKKTHES